MRTKFGAICLLGVLVLPSCSARSHTGTGPNGVTAFACADLKTSTIGGRSSPAKAPAQAVFVVDPGAGQLSVQDGATFTDACLGCSVTKQGSRIVARAAGHSIDIDLNHGTGSESLHSKAENVEHRLSGCHIVAVPANYAPLY